MEKRKLEKLGIETSLLGFGCMRFPIRSDGSIDEPQAEAMLDRAIAAGVNYIDTAYPYHGGESEPFVGRALKKYDRSSYFLATKMPVWMVNEKADAEKVFAQQLARLRTDYVDFYLLHAMSRERWEKMRDLGIVELCEKWQAEGKIRYFGFSFHDEYDVFEEIINYRDWDFCQIQFNYMDTEEQAGLRGYRLAEEKGVPLVIMEPIRGGALAALSDDLEEKFRALDETASTASYALRWVGSFPNVKVILSGMSTPEQVEDNLATFTSFRPLDEKEQETVDEVVRILKSRIKNGCTGCAYCMPCPAGVHIPKNFKIWNQHAMYQQFGVVKMNWDDLGEAQGTACIECGACEAVCPQHLPIREQLKQVVADLEAARRAEEKK